MRIWLFHSLLPWRNRLYIIHDYNNIYCIICMAHCCTLYKCVHIHPYSLFIWLLLHLRPNYIHSASNDIHTGGPRATARARARARG